LWSASNEQVSYSNAGGKPCKLVVRSATPRIRTAFSERGLSDLLTARFRVRIPTPEPIRHFGPQRGRGGLFRIGNRSLTGVRKYQNSIGFTAVVKDGDRVKVGACELEVPPKPARAAWKAAMVLQLSGLCGTRLTIKSRAAIAMPMVAIQTSEALTRPLTRFCMTFLSEPSSAIRIISGGATTPLMTAV
jgi:hypothetical protein